MDILKQKGETLNQTPNSFRWADDIGGARKLIEGGFEYVTEMDGAKLFRKRK